MTSHFSGYNKPYIDYFKIEPQSFTQRINYFEKNRHVLSGLGYIEKLEVELDYLVCLFEIGKYHKFLDLVDQGIVNVINENFSLLNGENIYNSLLFKKSASLYNIGELDKAIYILSELIRINPKEKTYRRFLSKCLRLKSSNAQKALKTFALLILFSIIFLLAIEILIIRTFFTEYTAIVEAIRNWFLSISLLLLLSSEIIFRKSFKKYLKEIINKRDN